MRAGRGSARRGPARRWALAPVVVVALAGACASEADESPLGDDARTPSRSQDSPEPAAEAQPEPASGDRPADFEATPSYLDKVSDQSTAEAHRWETSMAIHATGSGPGERLDIEAPLMSGEQDGARFEMHMDMGPWIDELTTATGEPGPPPDMEMTMDAVGDDRMLYMQAPFFGAVIDEAPPGADLGAIEDLAVISDRWGRIDLTALGGFSVSDLQQTMGGPAGSDPRALLEVVAGAEGVEDLGGEEIDGTAVYGLAATVSMGDMLAAQGMDPEEYANRVAASVGAGGAGVDPEAVADRLLEWEVPFEVWVDGAGYVRRVSYDMDMVALLGRGVDSGIGSGGLEEFVIGTTMDFSDHGDEAIAIDFPTDAVDVTEAYHQLLVANAAGAAAAAGDPQGS